jgi:hypothetical protein
MQTVRQTNAFNEVRKTKQVSTGRLPYYESSRLVFLNTQDVYEVFDTIQSRSVDVNRGLFSLIVLLVENISVLLII